MTTYWWSSRVTAKDVAHLTENEKANFKKELDDAIMRVCQDWEVGS